MFSDFTKKLFIFSLLLIGGLSVVKWEREQTAGKHIKKITQLLDDHMHPEDGDFSGRRSRLCQMVAVLQDASEQGLSTRQITHAAASKLGMDKAYADILADSLEQNVRVALSLGLLDGKRRAELADGVMPQISKGPYVGSDVDAEYIVPLEQAPELAAYFANFILRPVQLTQTLGVPVDARSYQKANRLYRADIISRDSFVRVSSEYENHLHR